MEQYCRLSILKTFHCYNHSSRILLNFLKIRYRKLKIKNYDLKSIKALSHLGSAQSFE